MLHRRFIILVFVFVCISYRSGAPTGMDLQTAEVVIVLRMH